ncbi:SMP-30/gluconolactonase/LRE family protein [Candidatus Roizmanbacteria bacterium]|nr:SMP-30/gluconolactonase/LRE family protein [Candidatus Roizmanbacteria bacterium]
MKKIIKIFGIVFLCLLGAIIVIGIKSSLNPIAYDPPEESPLTGKTAPNQELSKSKLITLKNGFGPEDFVADAHGNVYTGVHDGNFKNGRIVKIGLDGNEEMIVRTGGWPSGLQMTKDGNILAADASGRILSINPQEKTMRVILTEVDGKRLGVPNDLDIGSDSIAYFSDSMSYDFSPVNIQKSIMEARPDGKVIRLDLTTGKAQVLKKDLYVPNGIALSPSEDFLLIVEMARYRILRHWLNGPKEGTTEVFIENLAGFPNGISPDNGGYWVGITLLRSAILDAIHQYPFVKKIAWAIPQNLQPVPRPYGLVLFVDKDGKIVKSLHDPSGNVAKNVSSVENINGKLYLGNDFTNKIAVFDLGNDGSSK